MHFTLDVTTGDLEAFKQQAGIEEACDLLAAVSREEMLERQTELTESRSKPPAGGQTALNDVLDVRFGDAGWDVGVRLFEKGVPIPSAFQLRFAKDGCGAVVATHNRGYLVRSLTILQIAATGPQNTQRVHTPVAFLMVPTGRMKAWSRMDNSVADSREAKSAARALGSIIKAPIGIIGLDAADGVTTEWESTSAFPGPKKKKR